MNLAAKNKVVTIGIATTKSIKLEALYNTTNDSFVFLAAREIAGKVTITKVTGIITMGSINLTAPANQPTIKLFVILESIIVSILKVKSWNKLMNAIGRLFLNKTTKKAKSQPSLNFINFDQTIPALKISIIILEKRNKKEIDKISITKKYLINKININFKAPSEIIDNAE